jgi:integrase
MLGAVRTKEKCPKCQGPFQGQPLQCPHCLTSPHRYFVDFPWKGQRIKLYTGKDGHPLDSWERAFRLLTAMRNEIDLGKFDPKDYVAREIRSLFFENYILVWLARRERECQRQQLARSYLKDLKGAARNHFIPYFRGKNIRDIRAGDIEDFRNQLPETLSPKTVRNLLGSLHKLFQDAYRWRDILHLPTFPQVRIKEPVTKWIAEEDQERILSKVREPVYRAFFLFLMKQGCRPSEARALRWEKVDLEHDIVTIDAAFDLNTFRPSTKEKDTRYLPLHPEVKEAILKLPRALNGFVFVNRQGRPLSSCRVYDHWRQAAQRAGIKITCYEGTRHSLASQAINRGVPEGKIGKMLGHKTPAMTKRYAKLRTEALKEVWGPSLQIVPRPSPGAKVVNITDRKKDEN